MRKAANTMKLFLQLLVDALIASTKKLPEKPASSPLSISGRCEFTDEGAGLTHVDISHMNRICT